MTVNAQVLAGRFRIDAPIAEGGMGSVYAATDLTIGRRVAIKLLHPELAANSDNLERMREEAFSLANVHHPNIVQLYDFHAGGPRDTFLVMELVEGKTLADILRTQAPIPVEVAIDYALQLISALAAAHAKGIIHRDIKPANLLVVSLPARRDLVKVLDFGIAKLTEETIRRKPTTAGILLGTPTYMAPEQTGGALVDARTDIYAAGLVLYRLLTGVNPFEGFDMATTLHRVASFTPLEVTHFRQDVPDHVVRAVTRALSKDPSARFPGAIEFAHALGVGNLTAMRASQNPPAGYGMTAPALAPTLPSHGSEVGRGTNPPPYAPPAPMPSNAVGASDRLAMPMGHVDRRPPGRAHGTLPPETARPKASPMLIIGIVVAAVLIVGLSGAVVALMAKSGPPVAAPPTGDAGSAAAPILAETSAAKAPASGPPPVTPKSPNTNVTGANANATASAGASAGAGLGGNCRCLPNNGNSNHGNNMRLAPKLGSRMECFCKATDGAQVCSKPAPCNGKPNCDESCSRIFLNTKLDASCKGTDSLGAPKTGTIDSCQFFLEVDQYAGPAGRTCKGFTVDNKLLDGRVFCPR